jgi:hypothetical protein
MLTSYPMHNAVAYHPAVLEPRSQCPLHRRQHRARLRPQTWSDQRQQLEQGARQADHKEALAMPTVHLASR